MNNDYVILIDENGEPYLAHAWGQKKDHKYKATYSRGGKQCCKGKKTT
jgi:hypothetical protein